MDHQRHDPVDPPLVDIALYQGIDPRQPVIIDGGIRAAPSGLDGLRAGTKKKRNRVTKKNKKSVVVSYSNFN
jgi:hypothetical protein